MVSSSTGWGFFYSDRPKTVWQKNIVIAGFREKWMLLAWFWTSPLEERLNGAGMAKKREILSNDGAPECNNNFQAVKIALDEVDENINRRT